MTPLGKQTSSPLTLVDESGKPTFNASSLIQMLIDNGKEIGRLPRSAPPSATPPAVVMATARSTKVVKKNSRVEAVSSFQTPVSSSCCLSADALFPADLAANARMAAVPAYSKLPPSIASSRRRRRQSPASSSERLPQRHARLN